MTDTSTNTYTTGTNGNVNTSQHASQGKPRAKRALQPLVTTAQQERKSLKLQATVSPNYAPVSDSKFPLNTAFVTSPDSSELFIKLNKHSIASLFSGQRYSSQGVTGYLVNFA